VIVYDPGMAKAASKQPDHATRICVVHGPEQMGKRQTLDALRTALLTEHGDVDIVTYDGRSCELADVLDELRSYGLMQQYKIVVVDEADTFITNHREALERYAASPVDNATLFFRANRWYKSKLDKLIEKHGCLIKCEPLTQPKAAAWLMEQAVKKHQRKLDRATADILVRRLGTALGRLDIELEKLAVLVGPDEPIDCNLIDQVVGRSSDEQAWAVQEALLEALLSPKGSAAAVAKLRELVDLAGQPDVLVSYFVADLIRRLYHAMILKRQGMASGQIAREMKMWGPRQATFMRLLDRLSPSTASRLFDRIIELDVRAKSGRGKALRNLEGFCAALADEVK
jgi:DNA polymerase-3 subunit delta